MFTLTEDNKKKFQKQVDKIGNNDESKVKNNISEEIQKLEEKVAKKPSHKIQSLIDNTKLLSEILNNKEFPLSDSSKKWIVFGLGYLVSDVDLIPDAIPGIGYLDDAMIISWVLSIIDNDVTRYEFFNKAIDANKKGKILSELVQGNGEQLIILTPGFIENKLDEKDETNWVKIIRNVNNTIMTPGISILNWSLSYLSELSKTIPLIDHKLSLKPVYDSEAFKIEWEQLKLDMKQLGNALHKELQEIKNDNPDKEIIIMSANTGSFISLAAIQLLESKVIDKLYLFGACSSEDDLEKSAVSKVFNIYNFYSNQDHALKFIFDNFEQGNNPIGLGSLHSQKSNNLLNVDVSKFINRHFDYKYQLANIINNNS